MTLDKFDQKFVDLNLAVIRQKLGKELYDRLTLTTEKQIRFIIKLFSLLESNGFDYKDIREWFSLQFLELDDKAPIEIMKGEWATEGVLAEMLIELTSL